MIAGEAELTRKARLVLELRRAGISDARVLGAIEKTPRELFVPASFQAQAYENIALPIGNSQTISQPYVVALMTERLELSGREKVLEVGTGSGYQTAVLAELARRVCSIERLPRLAERARATLEALGYDNVWVRVGNGTLGWPDQAPFDRIIVTAAAEDIPPALVDQLAEGGVMVLPLGPHSGAQVIVKLTKTKQGLDREDLIGVRFVPLLPGKAREL